LWSAPLRTVGQFRRSTCHRITCHPLAQERLPMSVTANALRELHRIHRQRSDLKERIERGPKLVVAAVANAQRLEEEVAERKAALTKSKMATDAKELQLKERETRIADLKKKLNSCGSNREYQALLEQIAADDQANSVLSDEILEGYDRIEREEETWKQAVEQHAVAVKEMEAVRQRVEGKEEGLREELARVEAELAKCESQLPPDFRQDYDRIAKVRGEDALAAVEDAGDGHEKHCDGCFQVITPQMYDQLRCAKPVFCKTCGRLLYLPEETSVGG
jgi:predicted  nucleic acid-binding Zn-ribbon protein